MWVRIANATEGEVDVCEGAAAGPCKVLELNRSLLPLSIPSLLVAWIDAH